MVGNAAENVGEPGLRIDAVELCGFNQRVGNVGLMPPEGQTSLLAPQILPYISFPPDGVHSSVRCFYARGSRAASHSAFCGIAGIARRYVAHIADGEYFEGGTPCTDLEIIHIAPAYLPRKKIKKNFRKYCKAISARTAHLVMRGSFCQAGKECF